MPELHLREPKFTDSAYGPFNKHREKIQKFRETGNLKRIYKNELDKACFSHDAACSDQKYLPKRTVSGKTVKDKAYEIARNPKYDGYQREIASMVYKFFCQKKTASRASVNKELAEELKVAKILKRRKVYAGFKDNIWAETSK